jgi:hypothetical protein
MKLTPRLTFEEYEAEYRKVIDAHEAAVKAQIARDEYYASRRRFHRHVCYALLVVGGLLVLLYELMQGLANLVSGQ